MVAPLTRAERAEIILAIWSQIRDFLTLVGAALVLFSGVAVLGGALVGAGRLLIAAGVFWSVAGLASVRVWSLRRRK